MSVNTIFDKKKCLFALEEPLQLALVASMKSGISDVLGGKRGHSLLLIVIHCFPAILERRLPRIIVMSFCNWMKLFKENNSFLKDFSSYFYLYHVHQTVSQLGNAGFWFHEVYEKAVQKQFSFEWIRLDIMVHPRYTKETKNEFISNS